MLQSDILNELEFEFSLKPSTLESFSHLMIDFEGQALIWDDELADDQVVAHVKGHRIDLATARTAFADFQQLFDSISPEISELGSHIIRDNNCFVECCSRDEDEKTACGSLLYIDELVVERAYRNRRIGTEMLKRMSQMLDMHRCLVALKAMPIIDKQGERRTPELKQQLTHFYRKLGFRHSGEHYMVKDARDCHAQRERAMAEAS